MWRPHSKINGSESSSLSFSNSSYHSSQDMLYLRSLMIGASTCGIVFNLLQPKPLFVPAGWGVFFIVGHAVQIYILLQASSDAQR